MKKMIMGIATMMMVFGTMTMNANNAVKNDKNNHGKTVVAVNNPGHNNKGHNDKGFYNNGFNNNGHNKKGHHGKGFNDKGMYNMGHGKNHGHVYTNNSWYKNFHKGPTGHHYINVHHCMHGYKVKTKAHHHIYAYEMVRGHYTGHMICIHCAKHMH